MERTVAPVEGAGENVAPRQVGRSGTQDAAICAVLQQSALEISLTHDGGNEESLTLHQIIEGS